MKQIQLVWWWTDWSLPKYHRWFGKMDLLFKCSILIGPLEIRVWRKGMRP